jgi:hypothetical protein
MNQRIMIVIGAVVILGAGLWLTIRPAEPLPTDAASAAQGMASASALPADAGSTLGARPEVSAATPTSTSGIPAPSLTQPTRSAAATDVQPIDVSPGFEYLGKPAAEMKDTDFQWPNWRRHQQLQAEPRDEAWAPRMEAALRSGIQGSLTARGLDTQRIELPVVECRTRGCEIQAVGFLADNLKAGVDLQTILPPLLSGPLADEFDLNQFSMSMSVRPDQRPIYLALLPRKKP